MISILYRSKMQKSGHGLTLQNGMDRGSFSTFSAVLLFVVSSLPLVCDGQYPRYAQPSAWQSDIPASLSSPDDILHRLVFLNQQPVKLLMQSLTGRNLLPIQLIKGLLCRLMKHQLVTMFFKEFFAVLCIWALSMWVATMKAWLPFVQRIAVS